VIKTLVLNDGPITNYSRLPVVSLPTVESADVVFSLLPSEVIQLLESHGYIYDWQTHCLVPLSLFPLGLSRLQTMVLNGVKAEICQD